MTLIGFQCFCHGSHGSTGHCCHWGPNLVYFNNFFSPHLVNIILSDFFAAQCRRVLLPQLCLFPRAGLPGRRRRARRSQPVCGGKSSGSLGLCRATIQPDGPVPGSAGSQSRLQHPEQPGLWWAGWLEVAITRVLNLLRPAGFLGFCSSPLTMRAVDWHLVTTDKDVSGCILTWEYIRTLESDLFIFIHLI